MKVNGQDMYRCQKMQVSVDNTYYNLDCTKALTPCSGLDFSRCSMFLTPEGEIEYEVVLKASDIEGSGCEIPILLKIYGDKGKTTKGDLSHSGIEDGGIITSSMFLDDIGKITGFEMEIFEEGSFSFKYLSIKNTITDDFEEFKVGQVTLTNPGQNIYTSCKTFKFF